MGIKKMLPPDVSSDIHQIIAKAIYLRYENMHGTFPLVIKRAELEAAADREFGYDIDIETGDLLFRPLTAEESEI